MIRLLLPAILAVALPACLPAALAIAQDAPGPDDYVGRPPTVVERAEYLGEDAEHVAGDLANTGLVPALIQFGAGILMLGLILLILRSGEDEPRPAAAAAGAAAPTGGDGPGPPGDAAAAAGDTDDEEAP